jgi:hypothetical protein
MNSQHYAITQNFTLLNPASKDKFLLLTKYLFKYEFIQHEEHQNAIEVYPTNSVEPTILAEIYQTYDLYLEIKKYTNKTSKLNNLTSILKKNQSVYNKENIKEFLNANILYNLIKKTLKNKTPEDVSNYFLIDKLKTINTNILNTLNLNQLPNLTSKEEINHFIQNNYSYEFTLSEDFIHIDEDEYNKIYELFHLFI